MVYIPKSINKTKLSRSLDYTRSREFIKAVQQVVRNRFSIIKRNLINEFESHPVTVEISGGVNAKNSSGTLGGKGNLFRFIGFEAGSDPISPISLIEAPTSSIFLKKTELLTPMFYIRLRMIFSK